MVSLLRRDTHVSSGSIDQAGVKMYRIGVWFKYEDSGCAPFVLFLFVYQLCVLECSERLKVQSSTTLNFEPTLNMKNGDEVAIFWDYGELPLSLQPI